MPTERRGWRGVGLRDVLDVAEASVRLLAAQAALQLRPRGTLLALAAPDAPPDATPDTATLERARRYGRAVFRATTYGPVRVKCLAASLALQRWLRARGIAEAVVRIGVRRQGAVVQAHAWVTVGDQVIGDEPRHVRTFAPIAASAAAGLRW